MSNIEEPLGDGSQVDVNKSDDEKVRNSVYLMTEEFERKIQEYVETYNVKPIQLYKRVEDRYFLDKNAMVKVFSKFEDKLIAIYCIAGKLRSGKSFMLAQSLKYLLFGQRKDWIDVKTTESFKHQNSADRVTVGIWIWPEPVIKKRADGTEVAVFLMDTQGWHDDQTGSTEDAVIFAMSAILSSVMIFNVEKRLGEDDLTYLQNYSKTAQLIDPKNKSEPFQRLIFLLRDWQSLKSFDFGYYDDKHSINGKNFKHSFLDQRKEQSIEARANRLLIQSSYKHISAYLMPHPGGWVYQDLEFSSKVADKYFVDNLKNFIIGLFSAQFIEPKQIGGQFLTGKQLIDSCDDWAEQYRYVPRSPTALALFNKVDESPYLIAYQTGLDYYEETMKKELAQCSDLEDYQNLKDAQEVYIREGRAIFFASKKMQDKKIRERYQRKLFAELDERSNVYVHLIDNKVDFLVCEHQAKLEEQNEENTENFTSDKEEFQKREDEEILRILEQRAKKRQSWLGYYLGGITSFFGLGK